MANYYIREKLDTAEDGRVLLSAEQLRVLLYVLATQLCRMDEPKYGALMLYGRPDGGGPQFVASALMSQGDFRWEKKVATGETLAVDSICAATSFPDKESHYLQQVPAGDQLQNNVYFADEDHLSVLALTVSNGQLLLSLQLSYTEDGEEYAREHLLKAYAAAARVFREMMPQDEVLNNSFDDAMNELQQQYSECGCYDEMSDLDWISGAFKRARQEDLRAWKCWQENHPEITAYFKD